MSANGRTITVNRVTFPSSFQCTMSTPLADVTSMFRAAFRYAGGSMRTLTAAVGSMAALLLATGLLTLASACGASDDGREGPASDGGVSPGDASLTTTSALDDAALGAPGDGTVVTPADAAAQASDASDAALPDAAASYACDDTHSVPAGYTSITSFGAVIPADGGVAGPALQKIVDAHPTASLCFPPGDYLLQNDALATGLAFKGFSGKILLAAGARFVCDNATAKAGQCLDVQGSSHASFTGVTVTFRDAASLPLPRASCSPNNAILVQSSSDITLENTTIDTSPGVGIWITNSERVTASDTFVTKTSADGLHFENVLDAVVTNFTSTGTGDDGLADTNIAQTTPNCGFTASGIHIHDSLARGIVVPGGCNATITDFDITTTTDPGISVSQDQSISSRRPSQVSYAHGVINGAGTHCGEIAASDTVTYDDITCNAPRQDGFLVYSGSTAVTIQNSTVSSPGANGFEATGSTGVTFTGDTVMGAKGSGFTVIGAQNVTLSTLRTSHSGAYGVYHSGSSAVTEQALTITDAAMTGGNDRAWWAENMTGAVSAQGVAVVDDQAKATGYIVGDYADGSYRIAVTGLSFALSHGTQSIQPGGGSSTYTLAP